MEYVIKMKGYDKYFDGRGSFVGIKECAVYTRTQACEKEIFFYQLGNDVEILTLIRAK